MGDQVVRALEGVAPDLGRLMVEYGFGDVYARQQLGLKEWELATIAALAAKGGCAPQLKIHIHGALNVGWTREEVAECFIQMSVYAGFPAALNALFTAKEAFAERDAAGKTGV